MPFKQQIIGQLNLRLMASIWIHQPTIERGSAASHVVAARQHQ
jgi:hypothetical protein